MTALLSPCTILLAAPFWPSRGARMRRALAVAAFAFVAQTAAGVDGVTIGSSAPRAVASLFDQPNVYVSKPEDAEALGVVKASGSFYIPRAVGAGQLLPNKID